MLKTVLHSIIEKIVALLHVKNINEQYINVHEFQQQNNEKINGNYIKNVLKIRVCFYSLRMLHNDPPR